MITTVTITGADDSVQPEELFKLADKYPFVEWGILVSRTSAGTRRFPSLRWIDKLVDLNNQRILSNKHSLKLSCHLCGKYVRELLLGDSSFIEDELDDIWNAFERVQINTHAETHEINVPEFIKALDEYPDKKFIVQYDGVNGQTMLNNKQPQIIDFEVLFDLSHGAGIIPTHWPEIIDGIRCGYAGGLSPENLAEQIIKIQEKAGSADSWIDMETHVRSNNDQLFDLAKVELCLQIAEPYISK